MNIGSNRFALDRTRTMVEYIIIAAGFAFAAAAQPGPLQAFLLSRVVSAGWKQTLPAAFAPLISDVCCPLAIT